MVLSLRASNNKGNSNVTNGVIANENNNRTQFNFRTNSNSLASFSRVVNRRTYSDNMSVTNSLSRLNTNNLVNRPGARFNFGKNIAGDKSSTLRLGHGGANDGMMNKNVGMFGNKFNVANPNRMVNNDDAKFKFNYNIQFNGMVNNNLRADDIISSRNIRRKLNSICCLMCDGNHSTLDCDLFVNNCLKCGSTKHIFVRCPQVIKNRKRFTVGSILTGNDGRSTLNIKLAKTLSQIKVRELKVAGIAGSSTSQDIIFDTGAQISVTGDKSILDNYEKLDGYFDSIQSVTEDELNIEGGGFLILGLIYNGVKKVVKIPMLFSPNIRGTYVSEKDLIKFNVDYRSINGKPYLVWPNGKTQLFRFQGTPMIPDGLLLRHQRGSGVIGGIHEAGGHANSDTVKKSLDQGTIVLDKDERSLDKEYTCMSCAVAKATRCNHVSGSRDKYMIETPFYLVHSDLLVLSFKYTKEERSKGSELRYIVTYLCNYTKFNVCFYLKDKSEVEPTFRKYCAYIKNKFKTDISYFHTDMGKEYQSNSMKDYYRSNGITHITTNGYASMENGLAERFNRTIRDDMRTNLLDSGIDNRFWPYVMEYSSMIRNKLIPKNKDKSPEQMIMEHYFPGTGRKQFISHVFKSFGRYGIWLDASKKVSGLEMRAHHCFYLGPSEYPCADEAPVLGGDKILVYEKLRDGLYHATIKHTRNVKYNKPVRLFKDIPLENFGMKRALIKDTEVNFTDKYGKAIAETEDSQKEIDFPVLPKYYVFETNKTNPDFITPKDSECEVRGNKDHMTSKEVPVKGADIPLNMGGDKVITDINDINKVNNKYHEDVEKTDDIHVTNEVSIKNIDEEAMNNTADITVTDELKAQDMNEDSKNSVDTNVEKEVIMKDIVEETKDNVDNNTIIHSADRNISEDTNNSPHIENVAENPTRVKSDETIIDDDISNEMSGRTELNDQENSTTSLANEETTEKVDDIEVEQFTTEDLKRREEFEQSVREDDLHKTLELNENNLVEYEVDRTLLDSDKPHETIKLPEGRLLRSKFSMKSVNGIMTVANISKLPREDPGPNRIIYQVVCHDPVEGPAWRAAHDDELESQMEKHSWDEEAIVTSDPHILQRTVKMQIICSEKRPAEMEGESKKKVRFVMRGDKQDKSTYNDTYSPTLPYDMLRMILAESVQSNRYIEMIDISTAYLNAEIDCEVYVELPKHIEVSKAKLNHGEKVVHRLRKAVYGLKQSGFLWYKTLVKFLISMGFEERGDIPCVLVKPQKKRKDKISIIVGFFVDDMVVSGSSQNEVDNFVFKLNERFTLRKTYANKLGFKDILGIGVRENRDKRSDTLLSLELSLESYITRLVNNLGMKEEFDSQRSISTPMTPGFHFDLEKEEPMELSGKELADEIHFFREVVGALQYIALTVRPDITYAANYMARFCLCPHPKLKRELLRIVRYVYQTRRNMIRYTRYPSDLAQDMDRLITYSDADHAGDPVSRKSTLSAVFMMNGGPVAWFTRVAKFMATSSTDAEVAAMVESGNGLTHYREVLTFLGILGPEYSRREEYFIPEYSRAMKVGGAVNMKEYRRIRPLLVMVDNTAAIYLAQKGTTSNRSKHMGIRVARARDIMENEHILYKHIGTKDMLADILTKPVTAEVMNNILPRMMVVEPPKVRHI